MIQLNPVEKPAQLTDELVKQLTETYKTTGESVWNKDFIKQALSKMSFDKCCYCECKLGEESKYLEVEHFHPKSIYPDEVLIWENLLPACKRCNGQKNDHNPRVEPIIHPVFDNPKEHLSLKNYRLYSKTDKGRLTIDTVLLNERDKLVDVRYKIGTQLSEALDELLETLLEIQANLSVRKHNSLINKLKRLLCECIPQSEYSATAATVLLNHPDYPKIRQLFVTHGLWSTELSELETLAKNCAFV